jgi:hypothetical protein
MKAEKLVVWKVVLLVVTTVLLMALYWVGTSVVR